MICTHTGGASADSCCRPQHRHHLVSFGNGCVWVGDELLLDGVPGTFCATASPSGLVLGLHLAEHVHQATLPLGKVHAQHFLAGARCKLWWMTPAFATSVSQLPKDIQFLLAQTYAGTYVLLCPLICDDKFKATLQPFRHGPTLPNQQQLGDGAELLCLHVSSGHSRVKASSWSSLLLIAAGTDPYQLVDDTVVQAAAMSGGAKARVQKVLPDYVDTFGWCTWDAFYSAVSAAGVDEGLAALCHGDVPARFLLVDDGWQTVDVDPHLRIHRGSCRPDERAQLAEQQQLQKAAATSCVLNRHAHLHYGAAEHLSQAAWEAAQVAREAKMSRLARHRLQHIQRRAQPVRNGFTESKSHCQQQQQQHPCVLDTADKRLAASVHAVAVAPSETADGISLDTLDGDDDRLRLPAAAAMLHQNHASVQAAGTAGNAPLHFISASRLGFADAVLHSSLAVAYLLLPGSLQPVLGAAVGLAEAQIVRLLTSLVKGPHSNPHVAAFLASPCAAPLHSIMRRFYACTDQYSKRLTCFTANAKFAFVGATAVEGLRPHCCAPAFCTAAAAMEAAGQQADGAGCKAVNGEVARAAGAAGGFRGVVAHWRQRFGVSRVFCWHSMFGYWAGTSPSDPAFAALEPAIVRPAMDPWLRELEGQDIVLGQQVMNGVGITANPAGLFELIHGYLAAAGVDGVKVDVQGMVGLVAGGSGLPDQLLCGAPALAKAYHSALEASAVRHFPGNHMINSMCHSIDSLYRLTDSVVARVSDDFFPGMAASHTAHIGACAYNALFMSPLVLPDWDMFHSKHPAAMLHAVARVISGGPMYVSDAPGRIDHVLLRRLVLPDGSVLRALLPGRPSRDCLFKDPMRDGSSLLKVWSKTAFAGLLAVFNIQGSSWDRSRCAFHTHDNHPPTITNAYKPSDIEAPSTPLRFITNTAGAAASGRYAVFSERHCSLCIAASAEAASSMTLPPGACDLLTVVPLLQLVLRAGPAMGGSQSSSSLSLTSNNMAVSGSTLAGDGRCLVASGSPIAECGSRMMGPGSSVATSGSSSTSFGNSTAASSCSKLDGVSIGHSNSTISGAATPSPGASSYSLSSNDCSSSTSNSSSGGAAAAAAPVVWESMEFGVIGMINMLNPSGAIIQCAVVPSSGCLSNTSSPLLPVADCLVELPGVSADAMLGGAVGAVSAKLAIEQLVPFAMAGKELIGTMPKAGGIADLPCAVQAGIGQLAILSAKLPPPDAAQEACPPGMAFLAAGAASAAAGELDPVAVLKAVGISTVSAAEAVGLPVAGSGDVSPCMGARLELAVKGSGPLLSYASRQPKAAVVDGVLSAVAYDPEDGSAVVQVPNWDRGLVHEVCIEL